MYVLGYSTGMVWAEAREVIKSRFGVLLHLQQLGWRLDWGAKENPTHQGAASTPAAKDRLLESIFCSMTSASCIPKGLCVHLSLCSSDTAPFHLEWVPHPPAAPQMLWGKNVGFSLAKNFGMWWVIDKVRAGGSALLTLAAPLTQPANQVASRSPTRI